MRVPGLRGGTELIMARPSTHEAIELILDIKLELAMAWGRLVGTIRMGS